MWCSVKAPLRSGLKFDNFMHQYSEQGTLRTYSQLVHVEEAAKCIKFYHFAPGRVDWAASCCVMKL